jgi:hypothetical protein
MHSVLMYPFNSHARKQTAQATISEEWSCSYIHGAIANAESICYESTQPQDTAPSIIYLGTKESEADREDAEDLEQESLATQPDEVRVEVEDGFPSHGFISEVCDRDILGTLLAFVMRIMYS